MFDLPVETVSDRKSYRKFRKFLLDEGFIMMQESIYCKLTLNGTAMNMLKNRVRKSCPKKGLVQFLAITEKQYTAMEYLTGSPQKCITDSAERVIFL